VTPKGRLPLLLLLLLTCSCCMRSLEPKLLYLLDELIVLLLQLLLSLK
jgi:hypothetical protein